MIDVAFISDLHLHPEEQEIQARFNHFIDWAKQSIAELYILGDFFHAWCGDDSLNEWSHAIALQIKSLVDSGIKVHYMHGNRDFLLGKQFATLAGWQLIAEPKLIYLDAKPILLVHGDRYCTKDLKHQRFRTLTRNRIFTSLFLMLPLSYRNKIVDSIRQKSVMNNSLTLEQMDVVTDDVIKHMKLFEVGDLIHGHTHKMGITTYEIDHQNFSRYVLSDWDDTPSILCYNKTKGLYFIQI